MSAPPPPPPQWVIDLNSTPATKPPKNASIADPPGYTASLTRKERSQSSKNAARKAPTTEEMDTLKMKKAWELAIAPAKQLPMNAIGTLTSPPNTLTLSYANRYQGMYMTGNTLQIFSIFMVFTLFKTPVMAVLAIQKSFAPFETPGTRNRLIAVKLTYVLMNFLMLALGIWKVNAMGLLPTTRSDWLAWEGERTWSERAVPREWL
ncbi:transmembrane protein 85 [Trematosphaeria pertusa]|uniref:ER membrane protein complex subunit 4 n=1 Tax=Trematosphaeria pertusa TaxID=390896 RepID=A0A6A6HZE3_9PLEO|nr:transmembrane protein 85 [Trematosphaeria pertusa]KAF2243082.1 transmembrane protein 85 [Trematosphaeria pertusa]